MNKDQYIQKKLKKLLIEKETIQKQIDNAYEHYEDDLKVHYLKVLRLRIKDEIEEIKSITG